MEFIAFFFLRRRAGARQQEASSRPGGTPVALARTDVNSLCAFPSGIPNCSTDCLGSSPIGCYQARISYAVNVYFCLATRSQTKVRSGYRQPIVRFTANIQSSTNLYSPAVVESNLSIVNLLISHPNQFNIPRSEVTLESLEPAMDLIRRFSKVLPGDKLNIFSRAQADGQGAESEKVLHLKCSADVRFLHSY